MYNGIINIYKEKGYTSFDVVAKLRGIFHQKKIGHTGTLDPDAEGVLPVCLGNATKVCELLMDQDKEYETVLLLGKETDTQDITGKVLQESPVSVDELQVRETIMGFVGSYAQVPPMYSARKVNGRKLYELAREGITVERKAKEVQIYEITILSMELPRIRMRIRCSKGTYIRTLCHDVGKKLGCDGCMEELLRTRVGDFRLEDARTIGQVEAVMREQKIGLVNKILHSVDSLFKQCPEALVDVNQSKQVVNGNKIRIDTVMFEKSEGICMRNIEEDELHVSKDSSGDTCAYNQLAEGTRVRLYLQQEDGADARFIGIYSVEEQDLKPVKLFL